MSRSKHALGWTILALVAAACSSSPDATPATPVTGVTSVRQEGAGTLTEANTIQTTATVESIDYTTRMVSLRTEDNRLLTIKADERVRNLAQVQKGDKIIATYIEQVDIRVRRPGEATPGVSAASGIVRAPAGQLPAATNVDSVTLTTKIAEIDRKSQTVVLENEDGTRRTVQVRNPAQFDHIAIGDLVEITFTEAIALAVERPSSR